MRKFGLMIAALGALAIAAPSMASAETIVIKRSGVHHHGHGHGHGARAEMPRGHGWHRGRGHGHRDRVVVVKKRYHNHY